MPATTMTLADFTTHAATSFDATFRRSGPEGCGGIYLLNSDALVRDGETARCELADPDGTGYWADDEIHGSMLVEAFAARVRAWKFDRAPGVVEFAATVAR